MTRFAQLVSAEIVMSEGLLQQSGSVAIARSRVIAVRGGLLNNPKRSLGLNYVLLCVKITFKGSRRPPLNVIITHLHGRYGKNIPASIFFFSLYVAFIYHLLQLFLHSCGYNAGFFAQSFYGYARICLHGFQEYGCRLAAKCDALTIIPPNIG